MPEVSRAPKIASEFTGWQYKEMRGIVEFCTDNDPHKPDFMSKLIDDGVVRPECAGEKGATLTAFEAGLLKNQTESYYKDNWSKVILTIMRYKNPLIANISQITSLSDKHDEE